MRSKLWVSGFALLALAACGTRTTTDPIRLMTLEPGHFHAALVQKTMYPQIDPTVDVYAPAGADLDQHLARITGFNQRAEQPTTWKTIVHAGPDSLERMLAERPGNVVMLAGNNRRKTESIQRCVDAGLNVLADKPMAIDPVGFTKLEAAFASAQRNHVLLYDVMTERFEITNQLQRALSRIPAVYGQQVLGTQAEPAVILDSMHYFLKDVAGKPLVRPTWFFDVTQQGEAIADVGTHLVDLVQWSLFPEQSLDYRTDVRVLAAKRWTTTIAREDFRRITNQDYPDFLQSSVAPDGSFPMVANGEVTYALRGVYARVIARWDVKPPAGGKDTHFSRMRGTRADLIIRQDAEQQFIPSLFVEPAEGISNADLATSLRSALSTLADRFPGLDCKPAKSGFQIIIPSHYHNGHEAHFAQVTERFITYFGAGKLPDWEVPNMLTKYFITTEAFRLSHETR